MIEVNTGYCGNMEDKHGWGRIGERSQGRLSLEVVLKSLGLREAIFSF